MIKPLTSLRFVFALMVFFSHICSVDDNTQWISANIFSEGYIGVGFFFILSGFILAYNYKDKFLQKKIHKKDFWTKRFARVYPVHLLTMLLSVWVYTLWDDDLSKLAMPFFLNLFLLQTIMLPTWNWWWSFNTVSWSISDEMFFYFSFPFIIYFLNRNKNILIALILFSCTIIPFAMFATSSTDLRIERFYIQPFFRIVDFLIGVLLYEIYLKIKNNNILKFANIIELFAILIFIVFFAFHNFVPQVYRYSCYYWLPISLIILIFSFQKGCVSQFLSKKYFVYLGEISYSFYMFHALVIQYFLKLNHKYWFFENYYLFVCFLLYFSIFISAISYGAFEKPLNKYIIKKLSEKG